ncbi:hypothetical protein SDJN03_08568, partial [Cucurbita argyrosperma subsp. sororia]
MFDLDRFAQCNEVSNEEPNADVSWKDRYVYLKKYGAPGFWMSLYSSSSLRMLFASYRCVERILPIQSQMGGRISLEDGRNNASSLDPQSTQVTQKLKDDFKERQQRQKNDVRC